MQLTMRRRLLKCQGNGITINLELFDLGTGNYKEDLESLPWHTFECKEGQNLAYLIDLLRSQEETL
jgi:phosphopantetheinyl transferase